MKKNLYIEALTNEIEDGKAKLALSGVVVPITSTDEAIRITNECINYLKQCNLADKNSANGETIVLDNLQEFLDVPADIRYFNITTLNEWIMFSYIIADYEDQEIDLGDENGLFGYVYNLSIPMLSELGYSFYQKDKNGLYRRIG